MYGCHIPIVRKLPARNPTGRVHTARKVLARRTPLLPPTQVTQVLIQIPVLILIQVLIQTQVENEY